MPHHAACFLQVRSKFCTGLARKMHVTDVNSTGRSLAANPQKVHITGDFLELEGMGMSFFKTLGTGTVITALMGTSALADVTNAQIWGDLKSYYEASGYVIDATEATDGNTLNVTVNSMGMDVPGEGMVTANISGLEMSFEELANGTVNITMPEENEITVSPEGEEVSIKFGLYIFGQSFIASGDDVNRSYDFNANAYNFNLIEVRDGDVAFTPNVHGGIENISGSIKVSEGDVTKLDIIENIGAISVFADVQDPGGSANGAKLDLKMKDLKMTGLFAVPEGYDVNAFVAQADSPDFNFAAFLNAGLAFDFDFAYGETAIDLQFADGNDTGAFNVTTDSGKLGYGLTADGFRFAGGSVNTAVQALVSEFPLPVKFSFAETNSEVLVPLSKSDTPNDARFLLKYIGLEVDESLWGMVDPGQILPHTPANLVVDMDASLNWIADLLNPENAHILGGGEFPGELHNLNVNAIEVTAAGASLTGNGAFTFNNDDKSTFDGLPAPVGKLGLQLVGGHGLMDKLVQMGLLSQDDANGVRLMSGLFTRPGEGEDTLMSDVEVTDGGAVLVNGQPMPMGR